MDEPLSIFVYGTLKRGEVYQSCWPHQPVSIEWATLEGELRDLGPYPALLEGDDIVLGELWEFSPEHLPATVERLDELEGYRQGGDDLYVRRVVHCVTLGAEEKAAYAYFYARASSIASHPVVLPDRDGYCQWHGR